MNGLRVGHFGGSNDGRHVKVRQAGRCRADTDRFICQLDVFGLAVGLGVHHHGLDAHFTAGTLDAQGDFTTVGDKDFFKHLATSTAGIVRHTQPGQPVAAERGAGNRRGKALDGFAPCLPLSLIALPFIR